MQASLEDIYKSLGELKATAKINSDFIKDVNEKIDKLSNQLSQHELESESYRQKIISMEESVKKLKGFKKDSETKSNRIYGAIIAVVIILQIFIDDIRTASENILRLINGG